ncbi:MAG: AtpZ/AtpI family protein [Patescibacteria group bacterium]|jgi:F0F1-type ATP synthase assembly protein I
MSENPLPKKDPSLAEAVGIVWEVVVITVVPTIVFALGGRWLDRRYETTPLFLGIGLLFTLVVIAVLVMKRGKEIAKKL